MSFDVLCTRAQCGTLEQSHANATGGIAGPNVGKRGQSGEGEGESEVVLKWDVLISAK